MNTFNKIIIAVALLVQLPAHGMLRRLAGAFNNVRLAAFKNTFANNRAFRTLNGKQVTVCEYNPHSNTFKDFWGREIVKPKENEILVDRKDLAFFFPDTAVQTPGYYNYAQNWITRFKHGSKLRKEGIKGLRGQFIYDAAAENNTKALNWYLDNTNPTLTEINWTSICSRMNNDTRQIIERAAFDKALADMNFSLFD